MIIDVSHHQGVIDWATAAPHVELAIIRASVAAHADDKAERNWTEARKHGVTCGLYHYYQHGVPLRDQLHACSEAIHPGALYEAECVVLDVEYAGPDEPYPNLLDASDFDPVLEWLFVMAHWHGKMPWVYTSKYSWPFVEASEIGSYPLWVADYSRETPRLPLQWSRCALHQYSSTERCPGVPTLVDANRRPAKC